MFNIPDIYKINLSLTDAEHVMSRYNEYDITIIDNMRNLLDEWNQHCDGADFFADDDEFFEYFKYEVNAFNILYTEMQHLFVGE